MLQALVWLCFVVERHEFLRDTIEMLVQVWLSAAICRIRSMVSSGNTCFQYGVARASSRSLMGNESMLRMLFSGKLKTKASTCSRTTATRRWLKTSLIVFCSRLLSVFCPSICSTMAIVGPKMSFARMPERRSDSLRGTMGAKIALLEPHCYFWSPYRHPYLELLANIALNIESVS